MPEDLCPQCRTRNVVPVGAAGIIARRADRTFSLEEENPRRCRRASFRAGWWIDFSPRGSLSGRSVCCCFFVAFWGGCRFLQRVVETERRAISASRADPVCRADGSADLHSESPTRPPVPYAGAGDRADRLLPQLQRRCRPPVPSHAPCVPPLVVIPNDEQIGQAIRDGAAIF